MNKMVINKNYTHNRGISILGIIILGFILILVLSFFNISIKRVAESPIGQENFGYVEDTSKSIWDKYFKEPVQYLWNDVWIDIFWASFISNMERIRDGQPTDFDTAVPSIDFSNNLGN